MAGLFDFMGGGGDVAGTAAGGAAASPGMWDWMQDPKNTASLVTMLGGAAKAIDPQGQTAGGAIGGAIQGAGQSVIAAKAAAQQQAQNKALMKSLGLPTGEEGQGSELKLTPPDQPGLTGISMDKTGNYKIDYSPNKSLAERVQKPNIPSAFGPGGASNFP